MNKKIQSASQITINRKDNEPFHILSRSHTTSEYIISVNATG